MDTLSTRPAPAPSPSNPTAWQRQVGLLYGVAVGDALGLPHEHLGRCQGEPITGYARSLAGAEGTWSDDTALSAATLRGIAKTLNEGGDTRKRLYQVFGRTHAPRMGKTVEHAIKNRRPDPTSQSVGALMRIGAAGLYVAALEDDLAAIKELKLVAELTHTHWLAVLPAVECGLAVREIMTRPPSARRHPLQVLRHAAWDAAGLSREIRAYLDYRLDDPKRMDACHALRFWLHIFEDKLGGDLGNLPGFEEGILDVVNDSWDKDTSGAIAGAILGCHWGVEGIPSRFIKGLKKKHILDKSLAEFQEGMAFFERLKKYMTSNGYSPQGVDDKTRNLIAKAKAEHTSLDDADFDFYVEDKPLRIGGRFCLVVKRSRLEEVFHGGAFEFVTRHYFMMNDEVAIRGSMGGDDFEAPAREMEAKGLQPQEDFLVVDGHPWLDENNPMHLHDTGVDWLEQISYFGVGTFVELKRSE